MSFRLADKLIAPGQSVLVIAEIGVNHDGSPQRALELVDHAAAAGADAVKLQIFRADRLMHRTGRFAQYQQSRCAEPDPVAMLQRYELSFDECQRIVDHIRGRGLIPLATPFSLDDLPILAGLDLPAVKIASPDLVNWPLLRAAAALQRPLLLSTGAATLEEVDRTVTQLRQWGVNFALLHCISSYPVADARANLAWIGELAARYAVPTGYSDHTAQPLAGALAVAGGACIIEKHLTYDRSASGPDHAASADPAQFADYVRLIRLATTLRGQGGKCVDPSEHDVRAVSRQSLVLTRDLPAGHILTDADLTTQRPATGIPAWNFPQLVGKRLGQSCPRGTMLTPDLLES